MVGVERGDEEVPVGVGDAERQAAHLQLDERGAVELRELAERDDDGEAGGPEA